MERRLLVPTPGLAGDSVVLADRDHDAVHTAAVQITAGGATENPAMPASTSRRSRLRRIRAPGVISRSEDAGNGAPY